MKQAVNPHPSTKMDPELPSDGNDKPPVPLRDRLIISALPSFYIMRHYLNGMYS